jgi:hypothetical protein
VNVLDENIDYPTRQLLRRLKVPFRHISTDIGRSGMKDLNEVIPLLHSLKHPTFFTRDADFYSARLRHARYCLVYIDVASAESARYIARLLRHRQFRNRVERAGKVIRLHQSGISYRQLNSTREEQVHW